MYMVFVMLYEVFLEYPVLGIALPISRNDGHAFLFQNRSPQSSELRELKLPLVPLTFQKATNRSRFICPYSI